MNNAATNGVPSASELNHNVTSDPSGHPRAVPADLEKLEATSGYVVAACDLQATAERALVSLTSQGFQRSELVLISDRIGTLRPDEKGLAFEVRNPESGARETGSFAGLVVGIAVGASLGLILSYVVQATGMERASFVAIGAIAAAGKGFFAGAKLAAMMRRAPAAYFDKELEPHQILVGVDLGPAPASEKVERTLRVFEAAGLKPRFVPASAS